MNNIQIMQLKKFCQKHELDTQLIDSKISYTENRQYLETLVIKTFKSFSDLDHHGDRMLESRLHEWNAAEEEYLANHFLWYYLICIKEVANKLGKMPHGIKTTIGRKAIEEWLEKHGDLQVYLCRSCGHHFTLNLGFEGMRATPQIITSAMQLYFTGESLRNVQKFLKLQGVKVSHVSVLKWIKKYTALMNKYLEQIKPNVSDTWRADELYVKINGNMKYLFAMMDDQTRFWIAQEVAESKDKHDTRKLLQMAKEAMGKKPMTFITDGLPSYHNAYKKEFWTLKGPRTEHVRHITLRGDHNNNKMERMNGEVRDREKTMRGLKKDETPILKGYQIFHNYIREHEGLDGKTPLRLVG